MTPFLVSLRPITSGSSLSPPFFLVASELAKVLCGKNRSTIDRTNLSGVFNYVLAYFEVSICTFCIRVNFYPFFCC